VNGCVRGTEAQRHRGTEAYCSTDEVPCKGTQKGNAFPHGVGLMFDAEKFVTDLEAWKRREATRKRHEETPRGNATRGGVECPARAALHGSARIPIRLRP
jgi:hypothetical protein